MKYIDANYYILKLEVTSYLLQLFFVQQPLV
jgi:hypothetical protein